MFACVNNKIKLYRFQIGDSLFFTAQQAQWFKTANAISSEVEEIDTSQLEWLEGIEVKNYSHAVEIYNKGRKPISIKEQISNLELALVELYEGGAMDG